MAEIKIDAKQLIEKFKRFEEDTSHKIGTAMNKACQAVVREAKQRAPVDDGLLRRSITHRVTEHFGEVIGQVGTNVHYAIHVEYGHRTRLGTGQKASALRAGVFSERLKRKKKRRNKDGSVVVDADGEVKYRPRRKASSYRKTVAYVPGRYFLKGALHAKGLVVRRILTDAVKDATGEIKR